MNFLFKNITNIVFTICTSLFLIGCGDKYLKHSENDIKIVVADSINLISIDPRETDYLHQIVNVLERTTVDKKDDSAKMAHIFHPTIVRLDNNEVAPFEIKVESFSGNVDNTKVINKSINELFEEENVKKVLKGKKSFFLNFDTKKADIATLENYINKAKKDSIFFFEENSEISSIQIGLKKYKIFNDIDLLRVQIMKSLNENEKASFMIILGIPLSAAPAINTTIWSSTGSNKCINNVSHYEEKSNTGEVRWVNSGVNCSKAIKVVAHTFVSKKVTLQPAPTNTESASALPKPLKIEEVKVESVKDGNVKNIIPNSKKQN